MQIIPNLTNSLNNNVIISKVKIPNKIVSIHYVDGALSFKGVTPLRSLLGNHIGEPNTFTTRRFLGL
jgi:hypothetical protein